MSLHLPLIRLHQLLTRLLLGPMPLGRTRIRLDQLLTLIRLMWLHRLLMRPLLMVPHHLILLEEVGQGILNLSSRGWP